MRAYGKWAGNPKGVPEDVTLCVVEVGGGAFVDFRQCSRRRGHGDGGLLCWQHAQQAEDGRALWIPNDVAICPDCGDPEDKHVDNEGRWVPCLESVLGAVVGRAALDPEGLS